MKMAEFHIPGGGGGGRGRHLVKNLLNVLLCQLKALLQASGRCCRGSCATSDLSELGHLRRSPARVMLDTPL